MYPIVSPIAKRENRNSKDHYVIRVVCPHCKGTHSHGIAKSEQGLQSRVADCGKGVYYITLRSER